MANEKKNRTEREIRPDFIFVLIILAGMSVYYYGTRAAAVVCLSVVVCCVTDFVCCSLRHRSAVKSFSDLGVPVTGLTLALMMPATVRFTVLSGACVMSIVIGRHIFSSKDGGLFNCAAIGFLLAAISFPDTVLTYPKPFDYPEMANHVSVSLSQSLAKTLTLAADPSITGTDLLTGQFYGPMGSTHMLILMVCAVILIMRRAVSALALISSSLTILIFTYCYHPYGDTRMDGVLLTLCSGMLMFGLIFLVCDHAIVPRGKLSRVMYGIAVGVFIIAFRFYGKAENAVVYAVLLAAPMGGEFDRMTEKLREFGERLPFMRKKDRRELGIEEAGKLIEDIPTPDEKGSD